MEQGTITRKQLRQLFETAIAQCLEAEIELGDFERVIRINSRPRKRLGMCKLLDPGETEHARQRFQIELSAGLLSMEEKIIQMTIVHELLHTCEGCFNHGAKWKYYAEVMNNKYGYQITRIYSYKS